MRTYQNRCFDYLTNHQSLNSRQKILLETIQAFKARSNYYELAQHNLNSWIKNTTSNSCEIVVTPNDWGETALYFTKYYGHTFAVLNMANPIYPGGGYLHGCVAQEENMFRRSDCFFSLTHNIVDPQFNIYKKETTELISAKYHSTFVDTNCPRVCIRDSERNNYKWLSDNDIFPFIEMRSSAQDLRDGSQLDTKEAKKRINAQFLTLKQHNIKHVILGAFGCGAFCNPPEIIAKLYKEQILQHSSYFCAIVFAIYYAGYGPDNYSVFKKILTQ